MRASFDDAKHFVLAALYETLYHDAEYETVAPNVIHQRIFGIFSLGFTRRALNALVEEKLVETDSDQENPFYTLSPEGLTAAENQISLDMMSARFADALVFPDVEVPASNRYVHLTHNQVEQFDGAVGELLLAMEADNGDPDHPGLRERMLGQIRAGRELIRAGEYKAYLFYEVFVRALGEIVRRYTNPTIVALANALLGAVISQLLQAK